MAAPHAAPLPHVRSFAAAPWLPPCCWRCGKGSGNARQPPAAAAPPPPEVGVVHVARPARSAWSPNCRAGSSRRAWRRCARAPPASCSSACSAKAATCKAGQALFRIDPAPYQAALRQRAGARWRAAQANLAQATRAGRALQAAGRGQRHQQAGIRQRAWPRRSRPRPTSRPAARRCRRRSINLGYATVTAPISGRIGRALVTEGALVGAGRGDAAGADPADRPGVRQLHAAGQRAAAAAPGAGAAASCSAPAATSAPGARRAGRRQRATRSRAGCCSPT